MSRRRWCNPCRRYFEPILFENLSTAIRIRIDRLGLTHIWYCVHCSDVMADMDEVSLDKKLRMEDMPMGIPRDFKLLETGKAVVDFAAMKTTLCLDFGELLGALEGEIEE